MTTKEQILTLMGEGNINDVLKEHGILFPTAEKITLLYAKLCREELHRLWKMETENDN